MVQVSQIAHSKSSSNFQVGGTAIVTFEDVVFRITDQSLDKKTRKVILHNNNR